jgi:hypothetical protein
MGEMACTALRESGLGFCVVIIGAPAVISVATEQRKIRGRAQAP